MRGAAFLAAMICVLGSSAVRASDFNPLGFYIGAAVGRATVRADQVQFVGLGTPGTPVPFLDVYGKAGVSRLQTNTQGAATRLCLPPMFCPDFIAQGFQRDRTDTQFGYGAGLQVKIRHFAIRAEYERISASTGDPDLLSVGALWSF
jgi:opacity protein-like surface antigen